MILTAWYMNRKVLIGVDANSLVFDGSSWVSPRFARYVALKYFTDVTQSNAQSYPIQYHKEEIDLTWKNYWVCKILDYDPNGVMPSDVIQEVDPNNGECLCGVTCLGTEIQNVPVYTEKE